MTVLMMVRFSVDLRVTSSIHELVVLLYMCTCTCVFYL